VRSHLTRLSLLAIACAGLISAAVQPDTIRLAEHLKRFRRFRSYEMPAAQYKPLQRGYLSWVTARLKAGASVDAMNSELKAANLLLSPSEPDDVDAIFDSHAGYLTEIEIRPTGASRDVIAIRFGTYTGSACNEDDTVALYHREPFQLLTIINAESSYAHGYILREVSVGNEDAKGRLIASAWVASNCTSNWNGNIFRIDVARAGVLKTVLEKGVGAFFDDELRIGIEAEGVTFRYSSGIADTDVIVRKAIARYEVHGGHATRVAPIAPSYGGFIDEWLKLEDAEVAQWSSPAASAAASRAVSSVNPGTFHPSRRLELSRRA